MARRDLSDAPHDVYRYYDKDGTLLYVGCTSDFQKRDAQHRRDKAWYGDITRCETERFVNQVAGLTAEQAYIEHFRPVYNHQRNLRSSSTTPLQFEQDMAIAREPHRLVELLLKYDFLRRHEIAEAEAKAIAELKLAKRAKRRLRESQYRAAHVAEVRARKRAS